MAAILYDRSWGVDLSLSIFGLNKKNTILAQPSIRQVFSKYSPSIRQVLAKYSPSRSTKAPWMLRRLPALLLGIVTASLLWGGLSTTGPREVTPPPLWRGLPAAAERAAHVTAKNKAEGDGQSELKSNKEDVSGATEYYNAKEGGLAEYEELNHAMYLFKFPELLVRSMWEEGRASTIVMFTVNVIRDLGEAWSPSPRSMMRDSPFLCWEDVDNAMRDVWSRYNITMLYPGEPLRPGVRQDDLEMLKTGLEMYGEEAAMTDYRSFREVASR